MKSAKIWIEKFLEFEKIHGALVEAFEENYAAAFRRSLDLTSSESASAFDVEDAEPINILVIDGGGAKVGWIFTMINS